MKKGYKCFLCEDDAWTPMESYGQVEQRIRNVTLVQLWK